jgi:hypothetical protein
MKKKFFKFGAKAMLVALTYQLVFPACAYALTTGPSQPEVQSFEPVGTTEMVDMFTGDFNYNIPLMDVEGYPINIFYHSGVGMEQEASWVGLGWNINPGEINRSVRGLPDDFNGETIEKFTKIKAEREIRIGIGANVVAEILGKSLSELGVKLSAGAGYYMAHNNYRGISAGISQSVGIQTPVVSTGINFGIGSQTGADIDFNASASISTKMQDGTSGGVSLGVGSGFNSRSGLKDISISLTPSLSVTRFSKYTKSGVSNSGSNIGSELSTSIPIGMQNYVPVITNQVNQSSYALQLKGGQEIYGGMPSVYVDAMISNISYNQDGSRPGFGFLYAEKANREGIMDFSRDKDITYNETMKNLPLGTNTYDVYSVNGQGTGGMFRPYRNDMGTFHDPYMEPGKASENFNGLIEAGISNLFELGGDLTTVRTQNECGPWVTIPYGKEVKGSLYEKLFFKQGGDLSYNQQQEAAQLFNKYPQYLLPDLHSLVSNSYKGSGSLPGAYNGTPIFWNNNTIDRSSRNTFISFLTAEQVERYSESGFPNKILSFEDGTLGHFYDPKVKTYERHQSSASTGDKHNIKSHHIGQFTQTQADGRRYVYDIPAINNVMREVTFAIDETKANLSNGYVKYTPGVEDGTGNTMGRDNFYSTTNTPSYAHSYLLTSVLSKDYVDVLGDGVTDDDLGSFTKFNYTLSDNDYRWRTPYHSDTAQYNPGFWSDTKDGKGNYIIGSRQQWYIRSIETKNYIAEFYTSVREDGKGSQAAVLQSDSKLDVPGMNLKTTKSTASNSYKLDSVKLYNKHDRYINKENAIAIKTVILQYDYSLCKNVPNSSASTKGKLTLKKLFIKYGNSHKNLLSPYVFDYSSSNPDYDFSAKDRWGNYKAVKPGVHNYEFPYTEQPDDAIGDAALANDLSAWNLTDIRLPSGGKIHVDFESDDYAYVQDKRAMQMLKIEGVGSSKAFKPTNSLYVDLKNINDYVYFKRRISQERSGLSMKDNYLENQDMLCYNFNVDITGSGSFENIKGYARFGDVGICSDNPNYGYIVIKKDDVKKLKLHPVTVYGINMGRFYLPHIFYPGYQESSDIANVIKGLFGAGKEMLGSILMRNPFERWVKEKRARLINISKSSLRLQVPSLAKKGGGLRVKQLVLSDNWNELAAGQNASYGKKYDYTIKDPNGRYGRISSGVASYEPMIGGEENPFHAPVPYDADRARGLPAVHFFQEEPFGESFFPGPSVGYASVKVSSIHQEYGRSAQAMDEHLFYTAKDFPIKVDYTQIGNGTTNSGRNKKSFVKEAEVYQGYSIVLNDMHGKPKAVNNYTIHQEEGIQTLKKITGVKYYYYTDVNGKELNNEVTALTRKRGTTGTYELKKVILGQDMDISFDSRQRKTETFMTKTNLNLNTFLVGPFPIFPFTLFHVNKDKTIGFKSLVTTKIIQQYGIVKAIENFDHDAVTTTENIIFDGETGGVLLTRTNNQFNDYLYTRLDPAYLAYEGMKPSYSNTNYEEIASSIVIGGSGNGYLYSNNPERFSPGDELWVEFADEFDRRANKTNSLKLWVLSTTGGKVCYEAKQTHNVAFWKAENQTCACDDEDFFSTVSGTVTVEVYKTSAPTTLVASGSISSTFNNTTSKPRPSCSDSSNYIKFNLAPGSYNYKVTGSNIYSGVHTGSFTLGTGLDIAIQNCKRVDTIGYQPVVVLTATKTCSAEFSPCIKSAYSDSTTPCALVVAPRYKNKFAYGTTTPNLSKWPTSATTYTNVPVKILRSGRRNNLDQMIQQTVFSDPMRRTNFFANTASYFGKLDNVISASANTFVDSTQNYQQFDNSMDIPFVPFAGKYEQFNPFVLGLKGNYRPLATYVPITKRSYDRSHGRFDGVYTIDTPFWIAMPPCLYGCNDGRASLVPNVYSIMQFWKRASIITRYDPNGNAIEEQDAVGNYSAAQYGYNRLLPVSVASNSRAQHFMFEGFEEYNMLLPQMAFYLNKKVNIHSFFGTYFGNFKWPIGTDYPSEQASGDGAVFTRHNQRYYLMDKAPSGADMEVSSEASHTGNFSLKTTGTKSLTFNITDTDPNLILPFTINPHKNYIMSFWVKSTSSSPVAASMFSASIAPSSNSGTVVLRTGNIDGWYLVEVDVDLKSITSGTQTSVTVNLPNGIYVDDVRLMPKESNMKCFVYDPITFKLMAQLDENHFATFFEYDQEGLLIRTKKETSRGIMTISESRRSNSK